MLNRNYLDRDKVCLPCANEDESLNSMSMKISSDNRDTNVAVHLIKYHKKSSEKNRVFDDLPE